VDQGIQRWSETRERLNVYHPLAPVGCYGQSYLRQQFARLIAQHDIRFSAMDVLDLGSGTGAWCRWFAEIKGTTEGIVGAELDEHALAQAKALSPIRYVQQDMRSLPDSFPPGCFDFVSAFVSLMFLRDEAELDNVLHGAHEVLREGGYFLVEEQEVGHDPGAEWSGWPASQIAARARAAGFAALARQGLLKCLFNRFDSYYRASFRNMDWLRAAEHVLPGRYQYYFLLLRKL
jgi:SAM-dependent methyltransferase